MFITFEGGEGTGKTTIIKKIVEKLQSLGHQVVVTREPGGGRISEKIRDFLLDPSNTDITPRTEALLYAASRAQHIDDVIKPALEEKKIVICDRYLESSLAYQGYARGLGFDFIYKINDYASAYIPDIVFYFDLAPQIGLSRIVNRESLDRLDKENMDFHQLVRFGYLEVKNSNPKMYLVNANKTIDEIYKEVLERISISLCNN